MNNAILVLGGGHQGLSMAAHLTLNNERVHLWNRTEANIQSVLQTQSIFAQGAVNGTARIARVSTNIEELLTKRIMITTTAAAHKPLAFKLAPLLLKDSVVILNPGRSFGAKEFYNALLEAKCPNMPAIAETQTIIYTCRRSAENEVFIYGLKNDVEIAALDPADMPKIIASLPTCLKKHFLPVSSTNITSFGNVGMILHCAPMLMNIGWIEHATAGFKYYYEGISLSVARFLEKLDQERLAVAAAAGNPVESVAEWLQRVYGVSGNNLYECLRNNESYRTIEAPQSLRHRYIEDDVPYGLVPLESAGKHYNVPTPLTSNLIDIANTVMDTDYRKTGRLYG